MLNTKVKIYRNVVILAGLLILTAISLSWILGGPYKLFSRSHEISLKSDDIRTQDSEVAATVSASIIETVPFGERPTVKSTADELDDFFNEHMYQNVDGASVDSEILTERNTNIIAAAETDNGGFGDLGLETPQVIAARAALYPDSPLASLGISLALGAQYAGNGAASLASPLAGAVFHIGGAIRDDKNVRAFLKENEKIKKPVYLTIDDGPSALTEAYLDILAANKVRATFFVIGKNVTRHKDVVNRMYKDGHCIANHSYTHQYERIYKSVESLRSELEQWDEAVSDALGFPYHSDIFRFPGGSTYRLASKYRSDIKNLGYSYYDWNCLNGDAQIKDRSPDSLYDYMVSTFKNQDEVIVLMHDIDNKQTTIDMLDRAIQFFRDNGYEFHTLDEKR